MKQIKLDTVNTTKKQELKRLYNRGFNNGYNFLKNENEKLRKVAKSKTPGILDDICTLDLDVELLEFFDVLNSEFGESSKLNSMCLLEAIINVFCNIDDLDKKTDGKYQFSNLLKHQTLRDINEIAKKLNLNRLRK